MAKDKKGFILYADQKELFDQLPNEKAGELIKHIFSYVNDENPVTEDLLIKLAFTPIKQQLKRDLEKFEYVKQKRSEAGKASALKRAEQKATKATSVESVQQTSTNPTVKENVNVNVTVKENVKDILSSLQEPKTNIFNSWLDYRKQIKKPIKVESTLKTLIKRFNKESLECCTFVVNASIESGYTGLFWDKYKDEKPKAATNQKVKCKLELVMEKFIEWNKITVRGNESGVKKNYLSKLLT